MNKLFTKIAGLSIGLAMAIGVGVAVGSNSKEATPVHATAATLSLSSGSGGTGTVTYKNTGYAGVKIGASSKTGTAAFTVASGSTSCSFFAAGWNGKSVTLSVSISSGSISPTSVSLTADSGVSGSTNNFTISGTIDSNFKKDFTLSNVTSSATISITTSSTEKRAAIWNANYEAATTYTISYNANGGSGTMSSTTGTNPAVADCTFGAPSGKQFSYWHTTSSGTGGTTYAAGDTPKKNLSLYAIWEDLPSDPYVSLTLASGSPAYKGSTVTVSATTAHLEGSGLNWTVTAGSVTGISSTNTSFTGTLASTGTVTIKAQDNGGDTYDTVSVTVNAVTVSLNESAISVAQSGTSSLTATVNTGSVIWSSNNAKVTVEADSGNALKGNISVAADATVGSTAVITATSTVDSSVKATCTVTVSENPFVNLTKVDDAAKVSTSAVYALSNEGTFWAGLTTSNNGIVDATDYEDVGFFKLESTTGGYYLKFVVKNAQTGAWEDKSSNKYVNNSSSTNIAFSGTASSVWAANYDATGKGVILQNTSNSNRFLGWNDTAAASGKIIKAYATTNLHTGNDNAPVYLYEVPQNKLDGLTVSGQTTTFTAGSTFSLGNNAVLTAHYSSTGNTTDLSGGTISYKINNVTVTTSTFLDHDTHNGKSVVITYTDAAGDVASTTAYTITVNYKPAGSISLNLDSAPLSIGGSVSLTATVGDEYADENDVSWSTTSAGIASISAASGTKTITVTGVSAGSATITATANGYTATCDITVTADPILNLKDSGDNIINDETLEYFTGDTSVMIMAESENVVSPVFNWSNEDDSVVTIDVADEYCEITIVGAGSSDVSVTVGALTRTVTFSIAQSGVTSLTLESSVPSGELFDGTYKNTLTLTPAVTLVGNATGVINWSSSDTDVATISSASTTAPTEITVTGVGEGTATITARSAYTPSMSATFDVSVTADGVKSLSWTKRPKFNSSATGFQTIWAGETTLGNLMEQNGSDGIGVFAPNWESEKTDSPTMGTGAHDVHIVLSDVGGPTSEAGLTPLTSSYVFQATDNGKYVVAFYEGKASTNNTQLSVTKWRTVMESSTLTETFDYSAGGGNMSQSGDIATASIAKSGSTTNEADSLRLGSGSATGTLTVTSSTNLISKIEVWVKSYGSDSATLNVGTENTGTISADEFESFEFTFDDPVSSVAMSTTASKKRVYVQKVVITSGGLNDIGKSADCLGLEVYIDTYLHMSDYTTSEGWCKDEEHNYYGKNTETGAKYHFNQLNAHQRSLLSSNSAYAAEWARLSAWAAANGESLNGSNLLASGRIALLSETVRNSGTAIAIIAISAVSLAAVGGYFLFRKKKEN